MKKTIIAVLLCLSLLSCFAVCTTAMAQDVSPFPQSLEYEYTGEGTVLPVYPSDGSRSFAVTVTDNSGNVLSENAVLYTFDVGDYVLEYVVYENANISEPVGTYRVPVKVSDTTAPVISVRGSLAQSYDVGAEITLPTVEANDLHDGKVDCVLSVTKDGKSVSVTNGKIVAQAGSYTVRYTAADSFGNPASREYSFSVKSIAEETKPKKKGCGSAIATDALWDLGVLAIGAMLAGLTTKRRKRHEK